MYYIAVFFVILIPLISSQSQTETDFDVIDTNADGLVSKAEFDKWYGTFKNHSGGGKSHALFASYDANGDGRLTVAEFVPLAFALTRQPLKEEERFFNRLDKNGDQVLTRDEILASDERIAEEIVNGLFVVADANRDGRITLSEFYAGAFDASGSDGSRRPHKTSKEAENIGLAQSLIASIDANHDNKLDQSEVHKFSQKFNRNTVSSNDVADLFRQLDENRDGLVSAKELEKIPEKMIQIVGIRSMPSVVSSPTIQN